MPRKKCSPKGGSLAVRMQQNSRLEHTHESMVDYLHGQAPMGSFLNVFAPNFFGLNFARPHEDDLIYSDEYYDDDDDDDDWSPPFLDHRPRSPSIQIRELTDQEAAEISKNQSEEEQRKHRTERNKRKKMRKKEKKRLEKENAEKDDIPEEEEEEESVLMPKPLETPLENPTIDIKAQSNESNTNCPNNFPIQPVNLGAEESSGNNDQLKAVEKKKKGVMEEEKESNLKLSGEASSGKTLPQKKSNKKLPKVKNKEMDKPPEVQKNDQKNSKILKKSEVHKEEETHTIAEEKSVDPPSEEFSRRSIELAGLGKRLAAMGQFEMAVTYYTDAIKFNPTEYMLFGNRSLCYERLEQYENALSDADVALFMQPNWIKGLFRKGKALFGLKRYYEASLVYKEVLKLESSSVEAAQELKQAQMLHLMEMGFSDSESSDLLKSHPTLEDALEALFIGDNNTPPQENDADQPAMQEEEDADDGEWTVLQSKGIRTQRERMFDVPEETRFKVQPQPKSLFKMELFPVWVGFLRPSITYMKLRELFSRAGTVYSIKMLLEQECALVNFSRKEDCERAIQYLNGLVVDGAPLTVRHPSKVHTGLSSASKECFFWRTTGCTEPDCSYKHIPEHKNMDRERFTNRLGNAGNPK